MSLAVILVVDNIYRVITMRNAIHFLLIFVVLCASALVLPKPGGAALGRSADSVEADRTALSGVGGAVTVGNGYSVHQINYGGTAVREMFPRTARYSPLPGTEPDIPTSRSPGKLRGELRASAAGNDPPARGQASLAQSGRCCCSKMGPCTKLAWTRIRPGPDS